MYIFFIALLVAFVFTLIFSITSKEKRKTFDLLWLFALLLLPVWAFSLWIPPYGPSFYGVAFLVPLVVGLTVIGILASTAPNRYFDNRRFRQGEEPIDRVSQKDIKWIHSFNIVVWIMLLVLLLAILTGHSEVYYEAAL